MNEGPWVAKKFLGPSRRFLVRAVKKPHLYAGPLGAYFPESVVLILASLGLARHEIIFLIRVFKKRIFFRSILDRWFWEISSPESILHAQASFDLCR